MKKLLKHGVIFLEWMRSERDLPNALIKGFTMWIILKTSRGVGLKSMDWGNMVDAQFLDKRSHISVNMRYIYIPLSYGSAYKFLNSYALNGSIAYWSGAIETHLMDS